MWFFWIFAFVPITIGAVLWWRNPHTIIWKEWLGGAAAALLTAGLFQLIAHIGQTRDEEMWSGQISKVSHYPRWVERWTQHHSETYYTGSGKNRRSRTRHWTTTEYTTHHEKWMATLDFGEHTLSREIDSRLYKEIGGVFIFKEVPDGTQSGSHLGTCSSGDRNIYSVFNNTGAMYPVHATFSFENRVKAAPSLFSFSKISKDLKEVFDWPSQGVADVRESWPQWMVSQRLLGEAKRHIDISQWDMLNSRLGPTKKVNLIMIGFKDAPKSYAEFQEAKWIGGKKNDLVLCYGGGGPNESAQWAYVFGWTESNLVKRNLETLLASNPIDNRLLGLIESEIRNNYTIKDWSKFDYITIEPPAWSYVVYLLVTLVAQAGLYYWFHANDIRERWRF